MSLLILRVATLLYAVSAGLYVAGFVRLRQGRLASAGYAVLAVAFVVHGAGIGIGCSEFGGKEFFTLRGSVILAAWLAAGTYLVLHKLYRLPSVGAFVLPLVLAALVPASLTDPTHPDVPAELVRSSAFHVMAAVLSVALFGIAFGVAIMYLLQDREMKGKRFGSLFSRLPALEALDRLGQRLVRVGFLVFTVAVFTGGLQASAKWPGRWPTDPQLLAMCGIWFLYAVAIQLRHRGWRGRRYAILTLVAFGVLVGTIGTLSVFPELTQHSGDFGASLGAGSAP